jgi:glycogen debranching enzyme
LDEVSTQQYYIATKSAPPDDRTRVLKYGHSFGVFDRYGDVEPSGMGEEGIFYQGTRFLSELALFIGKSRPLLLSSTVREDNSLFTTDLTNLDISQDGHLAIARGTLLLTRSKFLYDNACYEQLQISNFGLQEIRIPVALKFDADYADIFEVRGSKRSRRGRKLDPIVERQKVILSYEGLDGVTRRTSVHMTPAPKHVSSSDCRFDVVLAPKEQLVVRLVFTFTCDETRDDSVPYETALADSTTRTRAAGGEGCQIESLNTRFNAWMSRSVADIHMMTVGNPERDYPYAGVPWFSTVFGRDGIITAMECLWANPCLARGVLAYLAKTQATEVIAECDAEPGKILHESRRGEMAALGEVPFGKYYGSVDATPLFVMLAGAYYERTGDTDFLKSMWPHVERALTWMSDYGDKDRDGFIEYSRDSVNGLVQQGWKDSNDSVFHADGSLAKAPIALCEVQGYAYAAKRWAARMAAALGKADCAKLLEAEASALKRRFNEAFWCPDLGMYALALDDGKKPCRVRTSNPGHCLFTEIAEPAHAHSTAQVLIGEDFFNGWGVRTVGATEPRYNPVSYHNGSVWPHDNAIIAAGLARYGFRQHAARILEGLLDVSTFVDLHRLPELFCGLDRRSGEGPTAYPVACSPQAWAAGAVYMLLEACLGIGVSSIRKQIVVEKPYLPEPLRDLTITGLSAGAGSVDMLFKREDGRVRVQVLSNSSEFDVVLR